MILFFNNPYDNVSNNTLNLLFVNNVYPLRVDRLTHDDDRGFWISFLPTLLLCTEDGKTELARIEDFTKITPAAVAWMQAQDTTKPIDGSTAPDGVIMKGATTA